MKLFYVTLNNQNEASAISRILLEKQLAVCTNWFPINCMYKWQGEIKQDAEVVLIIKTQDGMKEEVESEIANHISYTNFIAEIETNSVNGKFLQWLNAEVPI